MKEPFRYYEEPEPDDALEPDRDDDNRDHHLDLLKEDR